MTPNEKQAIADAHVDNTISRAPISAVSFEPLRTRIAKIRELRGKSSWTHGEESDRARAVREIGELWPLVAKLLDQVAEAPKDC